MSITVHCPPGNGKEGTRELDYYLPFINFCTNSSSCVTLSSLSCTCSLCIVYSRYQRDSLESALQSEIGVNTRYTLANNLLLARIIVSVSNYQIVSAIQVTTFDLLGWIIVVAFTFYCMNHRVNIKNSVIDREKNSDQLVHVKKEAPT